MSTPIGSSTTPAALRLAQAYGVTPTVKVKPVAAPTQAEAVAPSMRVPPAVETKATGAVSRLVAGAVPGAVDFSGDAPRPSVDAVPLYTHPADRNAAATGVQAGRVVVGRVLDAQG